METTTRKFNLPAIAFALAALTSTVPAAGSADDGPQTEYVNYGDLDLTSQAGVKALDRRLDRAVSRVCGSAPFRDVLMQHRIGKCRKETWRSIRSDREIAIAGATERRNGAVGWAENASGGRTVAARAE